MMEVGQGPRSGTCCLCLSQDESTFHSNSIMKSLPLHEMVSYCIGIKINSDANHETTFSTTICNECVLNISNFYSFKKKILDAQNMMYTLDGDNTDKNEHLIEYIEDETFQITELSKDAERVVHVEHIVGNDLPTIGTKVVVAPKLPSEKPIKRPPYPKVIRVVESDDTKKRSNEDGIIQKVFGKKSKADKNEKITIQINECLICPADLGDILQLKNHIDAHKIITCKVCGRQFGRYSNLKRHFNANHTKPKPFQCDICGLAFNFSVNLQTHAQIHYKKTK